jgi:hypothetical protein
MSLAKCRFPPKKTVAFIILSHPLINFFIGIIYSLGFKASAWRKTLMPSRRAIQRETQFSPEVPEFNVCANLSVDEKTRNAVRDALISLDVSKADEAEVLRSLGKDCTGFMKASESDYNIFREKIHAIETEIDADAHLHGMRSFRSSE